MSLGFLLTSLLWTGLVALFAEGLTRVKTPPHFAQTVWRITAVFMVLPWLGLILAPLLPAAPLALPDFPNLIEFGVAQPISTASDAATQSTINVRIPSLHKILLFGLVAGWLVRAAYALIAWHRLHVLKTDENNSQTGIFQHLSTHWATHLHLLRTPKIALISGHRSPFVSGLIQQTIYLPTSLKNSAHIKQIIAHECTHIARGDLITRPLERAVADLIWFSPFAWLARARLDYYREAVCDAETIRLTADPIAYARALSHVARTARPMPNLPISALILNKRKTLPMRISSILEPTVKTSQKRLAAGLAALLIATPLALAQGLSAPDAPKAQSFSAPIIIADGAKVASAYGIRTDPLTKKSVWHSGVDILMDGEIAAAPPIFVPASGTVIFAGEKPGYGYAVDVQLQASKHVVRYGHLRSISVESGDSLQAGDEIGIMGSSGRTSNIHLHFEYMVDGKPYNPEEIDGLVLFVTE